MSNLFDNSEDNTNSSNTELEEFLMAEKQKAQFNAQVIIQAILTSNLQSI
jgi:hypothetical protein